MNLNGLISEAHHIREKRRALAQEDAELRRYLEELEAKIKNILDESGEAYEHLTEEEFQTLLVDMSDPMTIKVEVAYALPEEQVIKEIQAPRGITVEGAVELSGVLSLFPDIDLAVNKVGVHGAVKPLDHPLVDGDRVEIYRAINADA